MEIVLGIVLIVGAMAGAVLTFETVVDLIDDVIEWRRNSKQRKKES